MTEQTATPQCMEALSLANEVRFKKADEKRDLKSKDAIDGLKHMIEVIETQRHPWHSEPIYSALKVIPKIGAVKAEKICKKAGVSAGKQIQNLTPMVKVRLVEMLKREIQRTTRRREKELVA